LDAAVAAFKAEAGSAGVGVASSLQKNVTTMLLVGN
jgi:hypothetical protein